MGYSSFEAPNFRFSLKNIVKVYDEEAQNAPLDVNTENTGTCSVCYDQQKLNNVAQRHDLKYYWYQGVKCNYINVNSKIHQEQGKYNSETLTEKYKKNVKHNFLLKMDINACTLYWCVVDRYMREVDVERNSWNYGVFWEG